MLYHLRINYREGVPGTYRGIVATPENSRTHPQQSWETGDPQADWAAYIEWARVEKPRILLSSSVGHFVMDDPDWRFITDPNGHEMLVPEGQSDVPAAQAANTGGGF